MLSTTIMHNDGNRDNLYNVKTDWNNFRDYLESNINLNFSMKSPDDIENACLYITNLIQVATWSPVEIWRKIAETTIAKSLARLSQ